MFHADERPEPDNQEFQETEEGSFLRYEITTPLNPTVNLKQQIQHHASSEEVTQMKADPQVEELWTHVLQVLKDSQIVAESAYNVWFHDTVGVSLDAESFYIATAFPLTRTMLENNFSIPICNVIKELLGQPLTLKVLDKNLMTLPQQRITTDDGMDYYSTYTFDNFVVGNCNRTASVAARGIAESEIALYNPFFIHGDSGLGKTHLSCAIATHKKKLFPHIKVRYCSAEEWLNEFLASLRSGSDEEFKRTYRTLDLLIVDDVQFLTSKENTLEELFNTFNALYRNQKQVIFTSDRHPSELKGFPDRIASRFLGGVTHCIGSPDLELRMAIIQSKATQKGIDIPLSVVELIAEKCTKNVREIEGMVNTILAGRDLKDNNGSDEAIMNCIKDILKSEELIITEERIIEEVASYYNLEPKTLIEKGRKADIVAARNVAIYIMQTVKNLTLSQLGEVFGGRDHSTIINSINNVKKAIETERENKIDETQKAIDVITNSLRGH